MWGTCLRSSWVAGSKRWVCELVSRSGSLVCALKNSWSCAAAWPPFVVATTNAIAIVNDGWVSKAWWPHLASVRSRPPPQIQRRNSTPLMRRPSSSSPGLPADRVEAKPAHCLHGAWRVVVRPHCPENHDLNLMLGRQRYEGFGDANLGRIPPQRLLEKARTWFVDDQKSWARGSHLDSDLAKERSCSFATLE